MIFQCHSIISKTHNKNFRNFFAASVLLFAHLVEDGKGLPAEALDKVDVSSADDLWVGVEVDAVVVPPQQKIPPGLDVRDLHGVTDGLDGAGGGA